MTGGIDSAAGILDAVRAIGGGLEDRGAEIERGRRLPDDVVGQLRRSGAIRTPMPRAWGGPQLDPLAQVAVIEELAFHEPSVGWVAMICCDGGYYSGFLADDATARALYPDLDLLTSGWLTPVGRAEIDGDHYRVTGRWQFGSGILHADRVVGGCLLTRDGELVVGDDGLPTWRVVFLPRDQVAVHDTWHTVGLAGSGSNDYSVDDVRVPVEHSFSPLVLGYRSDPLYRYHGFFFAKIAGIALGLARRAVAELCELAATKAPPPTFRPIRDEYRVQVAVAESNAELAAARALTESALGGIYETLLAGDEPTLRQRADVGGMGVWVCATSRRIVERMCAEAGTSAIFRDHPLERLRRDATAMSAHVIAQPRTYQTIGQMQLGITPTFSVF